MRFAQQAALAGALLAGHAVATDGYCPAGQTSVFTSAQCCGSPTKRGMRRGLLRPRYANAVQPPTCEISTPCCTAKAQGPPVVSGGASTNLQCGSKYEPDTSSHDVPNAVTYAVEPCKDDPTKLCLHAKLTTSSDATISNIHLNIGTGSLPSTGLGNWPYNKYCTFSGTEGNCWVPLSVLEALFDPASVCGKSLNVAFGVSVGYADGTSDTCFGQGSPLDGKNWFMYSVLSFTCPDVCTAYCCCPPPPSTKTCPAGTAYGYAPGYLPFNPNLKDLGSTGCNKWGWYNPVSPADLASGIAGNLHVGAGNNDLTKGAEVGTFTAKLSTTTANAVDVTYSLTSGYDLAGVHVYASCLVPDTCAPGQFTYTGADLVLTGSSDTTFSKTIAIAGNPPCSTYYLIFHASVNSVIPATSTCPSPINTDP